MSLSSCLKKYIFPCFKMVAGNKAIQCIIYNYVDTVEFLQIMAEYFPVTIN